MRCSLYSGKLIYDQHAKEKGVVIGHDHRHHSQTFANLTAAVFISLGFKVWFFRQLVHTPLVVSTISGIHSSLHNI
jgi:phosphomannomutase